MKARIEALFPNSTQVLAGDSSRFMILVFGLAALGLWTLWFFLVPIARLETSSLARIEVDQAAYPVQASVAGRIRHSHLTLGKEVRAGEVLVELEQDGQKLQLREEQARLAAISPQIAALQKELSTAEQAREQESQAAHTGIAQAQAQLRESDALARYAEQEAERAIRLRSEGLVSDRDLMLSKTEAERRRAATESLRLATARLDQERNQRSKDREGQMDRLRAGITQLQQQSPIVTASISRFQFELGRRTLRSPVDGKLGEVATLRPGSFVQEGDRLGAIVPQGNLKIVAEFPPSAVLGRIRVGQLGRLRLDGYPWTQYGMVHGVVTTVGSEIRNQSVQVELAVDSHTSPRIPMQHGLPGLIEIEVEKIAPASLLLRMVGKALSDGSVNDGNLASRL
jgi:multidrug resistance efflux pump